jgi:hypothetical protein
MKEHLRSLEVLKFKNDWVFVPTDPKHRALYDKWGISRYSCFQKENKIQ